MNMLGVLRSTLFVPFLLFGSACAADLMREEFNIHNSAVWMRADWWNGLPFESAWCPEQAEISEGMLVLSLAEALCHDRNVSSGEYRTLGTYGYGRYEARLKAASGSGVISSFFLYTGPSEGTEWDEIDFEVLGKDPTKLQVNYWRDGHEHPHAVDLGFDASADFHIYRFEWLPRTLRWFVDDRLVHEVYENGLNDHDSLPVHPGKIMLNLWAATGVDAWSGVYGGATPSAYYDYVTYTPAQNSASLTPLMFYLLY